MPLSTYADRYVMVVNAALKFARKTVLIFLSVPRKYSKSIVYIAENVRKRLLRSLMNIRPPKPVAKDFLNMQDEYLQGEKQRKALSL